MALQISGTGGTITPATVDTGTAVRTFQQAVSPIPQSVVDITQSVSSGAPVSTEQAFGAMMAPVMPITSIFRDNLFTFSPEITTPETAANTVAQTPVTPETTTPLPVSAAAQAANPVVEYIPDDLKPIQEKLNSDTPIVPAFPIDSDEKYTRWLESAEATNKDRIALGLDPKPIPTSRDEANTLAGFPEYATGTKQSVEIKLSDKSENPPPVATTDDLASLKLAMTTTDPSGSVRESIYFPSRKGSSARRLYSLTGDLNKNGEEYARGIGDGSGRLQMTGDVLFSPLNKVAKEYSSHPTVQAIASKTGFAPEAVASQLYDDWSSNFRLDQFTAFETAPGSDLYFRAQEYEGKDFTKYFGGSRGAKSFDRALDSMLAKKYSGTAPAAATVKPVLPSDTAAKKESPVVNAEDAATPPSAAPETTSPGVIATEAAPAVGAAPSVGGTTTGTEQPVSLLTRRTMDSGIKTKPVRLSDISREARDNFDAELSASSDPLSLISERSNYGTVRKDDLRSIPGFNELSTKDQNVLENEYNGYIKSKNNKAYETEVIKELGWASEDGKGLDVEKMPVYEDELSGIVEEYQLAEQPEKALAAKRIWKRQQNNDEDIVAAKLKEAAITGTLTEVLKENTDGFKIRDESRAAFNKKVASEEAKLRGLIAGASNKAQVQQALMDAQTNIENWYSTRLSMGWRDKFFYKENELSGDTEWSAGNILVGISAATALLEQLYLRPKREEDEFKRQLQLAERSEAFQREMYGLRYGGGGGGGGGGPKAGPGVGYVPNF